jgi:LysM repeat protein
LALLIGFSVSATRLDGQSLKGSASALDKQNAQARAHDYTYIRDESQLTTFVQQGYLTAVRAGSNFDLNQVTYPYVRPEVKLFLDRLGPQYRSACGEKLVVTGMVRPLSFQKRIPNGSDRSVHPTGMAVDMRSAGLSTACRRWLENVFLDLEAQGVLEATKERNPAHYHVVVFPQPYARYVEARLQNSPTPTVRVASSAPPGGVTEHHVRRGDSLWTIARQYGTTISELKVANSLGGSRIYAGQVLEVPAG